MNLPAILVGSLLLAAPAGYFAVQNSLAPLEAPLASDGPHTPHSARVGVESPVAVASSSMGLIRVRIEHHGAAMDGHLRILNADGAPVYEETITMEGTLLIDVPLPTGFYLTEIDNQMGETQFEWFWGSSEARLEECETASVESLFQTKASPHGALTVFGSDCLEASGMTEPQRNVGVKEMGLGAVLPYPTCPLQCSVGYSYFATGGLEFEIPEGGATNVDVGAHWGSGVLPDEFDVWLYKPADGCENCWEGIEGKSGVDGVAFNVEGLSAGTYMVSAHRNGPVGITTGEYVMLQAFVDL